MNTSSEAAAVLLQLAEQAVPMADSGLERLSRDRAVSVEAERLEQQEKALNGFTPASAADHITLARARAQMATAAGKITALAGESRAEYKHLHTRISELAEAFNSTHARWHALLRAEGLAVPDEADAWFVKVGACLRQTVDASKTFV